MAKTKEELVAARAAREDAETKLREAQELEELQLEDDYCTKLGKRGQDFEIVVTPKALIVIRKPDYVAAKRFNSASPVTDEDAFQLANACVVSPTVEAARALFMEHSGVAWRCAAAAIKLSNLTAQAQVGKF